jgi:hypothetical protein
MARAPAAVDGRVGAASPPHFIPEATLLYKAKEIVKKALVLDDYRRAEALFKRPLGFHDTLSDAMNVRLLVTPVVDGPDSVLTQQVCAVPWYASSVSCV